jgi:hypothetical protein
VDWGTLANWRRRRRRATATCRGKHGDGVNQYDDFSAIHAAKRYRDSVRCQAKMRQTMKRECTVIISTDDGKKCSTVPSFARHHVLGAVGLALGIKPRMLKMPSISPSAAVVKLPDGSKISVELAHTFDSNNIVRLLNEFVTDIEAAGGVVRQTNGQFTPAADKDWTDIGETYIKACEALGRKVVFAH